MKNKKDASSGRRCNYQVLVPEVGATGMVAVVRSLGRAGYRVHACSSSKRAIGLQSRFADYSVVHPMYTDPDFIPWLRRYVKNQGIGAIVPSEGFYLAVRSHYAEFAPLLTVTCNEDTVFRCLSKTDVLASFTDSECPKDLSQNIPHTLIFDSVEQLGKNEALQSIQYPAFVKADACRSRSGSEGRVSKVDDVGAALQLLRKLLMEYDRALIQESSPGRKATVNFCFVHGELLAESMCLAIHESPHTGGLTALRRTWWHQEIRDDALRRVKYLGWDGVAMVEYKWDDRSKEFAFIELNSRYWAALHLDLFANTDFPRIQLDALFNLRIAPKLGPQPEVVARNTVPADFGYAVSRARDRNVAVLDRLWAPIEFALIGLLPWIRSDFFFPGDRQLYFRQWYRFLVGLIRE